MSEKNSSSSSEKICGLCSLEPAKYLCPRCGVPYCSLGCYKNEQTHLQCSESFYKECVVDEVKVRQAEAKDSKMAQKMGELLQKFHDEGGFEQEDRDVDGGRSRVEELDSDDDEPLSSRLEGIDLNDADDVWGQLTEEERSEFKRFAATVNAQDVVPEWVPWWEEPLEVPKLVEEVMNPSSTAVEGANNTPIKFCKNQPEVLDSIPEMKSLTRIKPNEFVKRSLVNVLSSYVWTCRLYNGEFLTYDNPVDVASCFVMLSRFISEDAIFPTFEQALLDVSLTACKNPELYDGGPAIQAKLSKDVRTIILGPSSGNVTSTRRTFILAALTDCFKLLRTTCKKNAVPSTSSSNTKTDSQTGPTTNDNSKQPLPSFSSVFGNYDSMKVDAKLLIRAKRKIHYLLAFANENDVL